MGVPPAKLHEKPAEANKSGTRGEQKAGFFDPVVPRQLRQTTKGDRLSHVLDLERHPATELQLTWLVRHGSHCAKSRRIDIQSRGPEMDRIIDIECIRLACQRVTARNKRPESAIGMAGGEGEIRTPGTRQGTPAFEAGAIDHSATSPKPSSLYHSIRATR
jgi:hypothetical protein